MEKAKLIERREAVAAERVTIENKIKESQGAIEKANQAINELIALMNLNAGILSELDFQLKEFEDAGNQEEKEKEK